MKELLVKNHGADPDELELQIEYLVEASKRLGRLDWRGIVAGRIFTWVVQGLRTLVVVGKRDDDADQPPVLVIEEA